MEKRQASAYSQHFTSIGNVSIIGKPLEFKKLNCSRHRCICLKVLVYFYQLLTLWVPGPCRFHGYRWTIIKNCLQESSTHPNNNYSVFLPVSACRRSVGVFDVWFFLWIDIECFFFDLHLYTFIWMQFILNIHWINCTRYRERKWMEYILWNAKAIKCRWNEKKN